MLSLVARSCIPIYDLESLAFHILPLEGENFISRYRLGQTKVIKDESFVPKHAQRFEAREGCASYRTTSMISPLDLIASPIGNGFFKDGPRIILLDDTIRSIDANASKLFLRYSINQIKNNDAILKYGLLLIISVAAAIFSSGIYTPLLVGIVAHSAISNSVGRRRSHQAFTLALKSASNEEKIGAYRYLKAIDVLDQQAGKSTLSKVFNLFKELFPNHASTKSLLMATQQSLRISHGRNIDLNVKDSHYQSLKDYLELRLTRAPSHPDFVPRLKGIVEGLKTSVQIAD